MAVTPTIYKIKCTKIHTYEVIKIIKNKNQITNHEFRSHTIS
jgi:hypothetical protein